MTRETLEIVNLYLGPVAFLLTIGTFVAALRARAAARNAAKTLARQAVISELALAASTVDEIRRYQKNGLWIPVADRYNVLATSLAQIRSFSLVLSQPDLEKIEEVRQFARRTEGTITKTLKEGNFPKEANLTKQMAERGDALVEILGRLKIALEKRNG